MYHDFLGREIEDLEMDNMRADAAEDQATIMTTTNVREINQAIDLQTYRGTRRVMTPDSRRITKVRTRQGQLQARVLGASWVNVPYVKIEF